MYIKQSDFDKGRLALERFRKLIITRYRPLLRAVTGNDKLEVVPSSSQAATDGKTVTLPVPLALGDETLEHDKSYCGLRDTATLEMLCMMCKVEDETDALVFHESAHITERSFEKIDGWQFLKDVNPAIEPYLALLDPAKRQEVERKVRAESRAMAAANAVDPWLPFSMNVIEDIYVNRRLIKYRQGTELLLMLHSRDVFVNGIQDLNGESFQWKDNDKSAQALISAYLIGQNLADLGQHLDPSHNLTSDPVLVGLVGEIPGECPIKDRIEIAVKLLMHLRSLGYCPPKTTSALPPPPPPPEEEPEPSSDEPEPSDEQDEGAGETDDEGDESDDAEAGDGDGEESDESEGDKSDDAEAGDGDGEESDEQLPPGSGAQGSESEIADEPYDANDAVEPEGDPEGEPSQEEAPTDDEIDESLERAKQMLTQVMGHDEDGPNDLDIDPKAQLVIDQVLQQEAFDHPSASLEGGLKLLTKNDYPYKGRPPSAEVKVPRHLLTPPLSRLRVVFSSNRKTGIERSLKAGARLDTMHLYRAGTDDRRIFGKRNIPKSRDWFVCVGIDFSGSVSNNGAERAHKMAGHAIGELLHELNIKFEMYAHTSSDAVMSNGEHGLALEHVLIKGVNENWRDKSVQQMLFAQAGRGCNLDGHSMEQYRKVMEANRATDKLLMYFTDGKMPAMNSEEERPLLIENIEILRRMPRTHLVGVGYRTDSPKQHGLDTIQINSAEDIASIVAGLEDRLLR